jgi:ABC-2 type transport system ATP-binding protein
MRSIEALPGAPMVSLEGVSKIYRGVVAVSEMSCQIGPGVTALLGPNGAGKSTVLRLACGLTSPNRGVVRIHGHDPRREPRVYRFVGLVPQQERLLPRTTAVQFVELAGRLHGVTDPRAAARASLIAVELDPDDRRHIEQYSKGMRQRVKIAQALVNGPSIIVADEPLNGLDPRQRARMIETLVGLGEQGRCVIISSHVLDEVERFGSRVLVMAQGRLAAVGDVGRIRELMDDRPHRIRIGTDRGAELAAALMATGTVVGVQLTASGVDVATNDVSSFSRVVAGAARRIDASLVEVRPLDDDLESVFRYLVEAPRQSR